MILYLHLKIYVWKKNFIMMCVSINMSTKPRGCFMKYQFIITQQVLINWNSIELMTILYLITFRKNKNLKCLPNYLQKQTNLFIFGHKVDEFWKTIVKSPLQIRNFVFPSLKFDIFVWYRKVNMVRLKHYCITTLLDWKT